MRYQTELDKSIFLFYHYYFFFLDTICFRKEVHYLVTIEFNKTIISISDVFNTLVTHHLFPKRY